MLRIHNLSKTYPNGVRALNDVTLDIPTGMFGLLGPNGAGKSTLMRTIATLQEPDQGAITLELGGRTIDVLDDPDGLRRVLGYLPQEFGVYPRISAEAMLDHFAILKGLRDTRQRKELVERLLTMTNLYDVRKRKLTTYSGGMKQRFGIAQALIGDPQLIIVDEPTAGLDPEERQRFLNLLSEIGKDVVVVLSTHIVADVTDLCSAMAILAEGQVRLIGDPRKVMHQLQGQVWRKLVDKRHLPDYERDLRVISTRWIAGKLAIHVLSDTPLERGFEPVEPSLEDVYFATLRHGDVADIAA